MGTLVIFQHPDGDDSDPCLYPADLVVECNAYEGGSIKVRPPGEKFLSNYLVRSVEMGVITEHTGYVNVLTLRALSTLN